MPHADVALGRAWHPRQLAQAGGCVCFVPAYLFGSYIRTSSPEEEHHSCFRGLPGLHHVLNLAGVLASQMLRRLSISHLGLLYLGLVYRGPSRAEIPPFAPGYGVNTFKLIAADGKETLVKFHWYPVGGAQFLTDEQAQSSGEKNMRHRHAPRALLLLLLLL